jgi:tRNA nucleotidyltransferase/poly(A) polymerase
VSLPSLAGAPFLSNPLVMKVLELLSADGEEARVIGGAVRNALMDMPVSDVDIATTALPETVIARAEGAHLKTAPTGIEHGTVTLIGDRRIVEVTTLREDIETDGRRAVVRFGRDWQADALRRDFTMNALSVDANGELHDLVGGLADIAARRVRFIGSADRRIAEDRLRVLRFFRFHAIYGEGEPDAEGLGATIRARHDLTELSAERIGQEMRKLVVAKHAVETVALLQESGILPAVAAGVADLPTFARLVGIEDGPPVAALRFVALFGWVQEDIDRIVRRFRLSNGERNRMAAALAASRRLPSGNTVTDRALLYAIGHEAFMDGMRLAGARGNIPDTERVHRSEAAQGWTIPVFPLSGRDVVELGVERGPLVGQMLRQIEQWWIGQDFAPDVVTLKRRLQTLASSQQ